MHIFNFFQKNFGEVQITALYYFINKRCKTNKIGNKEKAIVKTQPHSKDPRSKFIYKFSMHI